MTNKVAYFKIIFILGLCLSISTNSFSPRKAELKPSWSLDLSNKHPEKFVLGYANLIATTKWLEINAIYGNIDKRPTFLKIFENLNFITSLNPLSQAPYYLAATLPWSTKSTKESNFLLTRAIKYMPDVWYWPYYLGFNAYWFDHNRKKSANYLTQAAALEGAPPIVINLALRMQSDSGQFDTALMFIDEQIESAPDRIMQKKLIQHRTAILTEKTLYNIELLLNKFYPQEKNKKAIQKLLKKGYHIPRILPDGGHIIFKKDGTLISSKSKKRFQIFIPPKRQGVFQHEPAH